MKTRYFVESNNGYGPFGTIAEFETYKEASEYSKNYHKAYGVPTRVTTI